MPGSLTQKEKELIAVGVSVVAGCVPCTEYHVRAGRTAEATADEIAAAIEVAVAVQHEATDAMARLAHELMDHPAPQRPAKPTGPADRLETLVAMAAAVAVNGAAGFETHLHAVRREGVPEDGIRFVTGLARMVRARATEKMDAALHATGAPAASSPPAAACGTTCC